MVVLELRFPARRFHASPWDHHVNEGVVEWPPSPWRILRALVATRELKARSEVGEEVMDRVLNRLSSEAPIYQLPRVVAGHSRHYMPLRGGKPTKVFDTFLHLVDDDRVRVAWPGVDLGVDDRSQLTRLVERLGYLGRAEAWVEACLLPADAAIDPNAFPLAQEGEREVGTEVVRVLAAMPPTEYVDWLRRKENELLAERLAAKRRRAEDQGKPSGQIELAPADRRKVRESLPDDVVSALLGDTESLRKAGWSEPPGSRWIDYLRPIPEERTATPPRRRAPRRPLPTVARFAVTGKVPPRLTEGVEFSDNARRALMSHSRDANGNVPAVFSGKDQDGQPLSGHRHAFILPESNGRHGYITHLTVFAPDGFDAQARSALTQLSRIYDRHRSDLYLVLLGVGQPEDFGGTEIDLGRCPLLAESAVWESRTPFVATRHPKSFRDGRPKLDDAARQIGSPEHDLRRLLHEAGLPDPETLEEVHETKLGGKPVRWLAFVSRRRRGEGRRAAHSGTGFRVTFPRSVRGPLAFGYGAHFGLGVFVPVS